MTFAELSSITQALVNRDADRSISISVIPLADKMAQNGLTERTAFLLRIGLLQNRQVEEYVENMSGIDSTFIDRLTSGFVREYNLQRSEGLEGDTLFEAMRQFSVQGMSDMLYQSAGLAVLVYLFERCEVFEQ